MDCADRDVACPTSLMVGTDTARWRSLIAAADKARQKILLVGQAHQLLLRVYSSANTT